MTTLASTPEPQTTSAAHPFQRFSGQKTILLTTYRRNGTPVGTPVSIVVEGNRAFMRSYDKAWKVKRMRRNPEVEFAPSTARGKITGPAVRARVRFLSGDEAHHAAEVLAHKYPVLHGVLVPLFHRLKGYKTMHFELTPIQQRTEE
jgi:PPOX class probable F420-dependent enzyme